MQFQPEGNYYDKYKSENPIVKRMMADFFKSMEELLDGINFQNILEAGCGEGNVAAFLKNRYGVPVDAFDISEKVIAKAKEDFKDIHFSVGSIYEIKAADESYDIVIASEVLEHMEEPEKALAELLRVSKKYVFVSVPREPLWRLLNLCRLKYIHDFGNTPGHIQHWSKASFKKFYMKTTELLDVKIKSPTPWTMLLSKK